MVESNPGGKPVHIPIIQMLDWMIFIAGNDLGINTMDTSKITRVTVLLFCLALAVTAYFISRPTTTPQKPVVVKRPSPIPPAVKDPNQSTNVAEFRKAFFGYTGRSQITSALHKNVHWHRNEAMRHEKSLDHTRFDLIVVPVQEQPARNDRVSKLLPARMLASSIEAESGKRVMSPELLLRLMGGRAHNLEDEEINRIASLVGADVVYLFIRNSDRWYPAKESHGSSKLAAVLAGSDGKIKKRVFTEIEGTTIDRPLELPVSRVLGGISLGLLNTDTANRELEKYSLTSPWAFPKILEDLPTLSNTPLDRAAYLQLIAMLTPQIFDYERRRLFERSLVALEQVDPSSDSYNLLMARAMFGLYRRPVALQYLSSPASPEEVAYLEYLNGNFPQMQEAVRRIDAPLLKVLALIDLSELAHDYNMEEPDVDNLSLHVNGESLIKYSVRQYDPWYVPDNIPFFASLRGLFPSFDKLMDAVIKEQVMAGDLQPFSENEQLMETVFARASAGEGSACCPAYGAGPDAADIWQLYRHIGIANLYRNLNRSVNVHASYETARKYAERLTPWFEGEPAFTRLHSEALEGASRRKQGIEKTHLLERSWTLAGDVLNNSVSVDINTVKAEFIRGDILQQLPTEKVGEKVRSNQPQYRTASAGEFPSNRYFQEYNGFPPAVPFTNNRIYSLLYADFKNELDPLEWDEAMATRFDGHPKKAVYLAEKLVESGKTSAAASLLKTEMKARSNVWAVYKHHAELMIESGDYSTAVESYLTYPGFKNTSGSDRVAVSNYAEQSGSRFFWLGRLDDARKLYQIASSLNTGAEAEFKAIQRTAATEGDYRTALIYARKRGERYGSPYGYRDYLVYLHLLGFHDEAEQGFKGLAARFDSPALWTSAFIGDRMQENTLEEMQGWTGNYVSGVPGEKFAKQGQRYMFLQSIIDRQPGEASLEAVRALRYSQPASYMAEFSEPNKMLSAPFSNDPENELDCDPNIASCAAKRRMRTKIEDIDIYGEFLNIYLIMKEERYAEALKAFVEYDKRFNIASSRGPGFSMPYFAMTVADSESNNKLPDMLAILDKKDKENNFDHILTRAVITGSQGDVETSLQLLLKAFHARPHTKWRPIYSWYQLTETAEWLYQRTGDQRFINYALQWARSYQVIQPQFAWAYAFEALYSNNEDDRIRATGYAAYLDSQSQWLSRVPAPIREKGSLWWEKNNPYPEYKERLQKPGTPKQAA